MLVTQRRPTHETVFQTRRLHADGRAYLLGDVFTVADAYLFVVCSWADVAGIDLKG
ncbi:glutathione S-transferase C-terminal domain-containing protein [Marinobacter iranensis]|uniref:glutathione S-transferase C-terminal domain-containing protein n=1 Tax=Marinobacter iranensis TaxID=2962607 RepID=UPI003B848525